MEPRTRRTPTNHETPARMWSRPAIDPRVARTVIGSDPWAADGTPCVRVAATTFPGDELTGLYRKYGPYIYVRCARLLGDRSAAEDATQETFMRVHRHLHKAP